MDATKLSILAFSLMPMATGVVICARHVNRLGLLHIHLLLVALSYGAYTFVDVLVTSVEGVDEFAVAVLMGSITASMILMAAAFGHLPRDVAYRFSVSNLVQEAATAPFSILVLVWLLIIAWHGYLYAEYRIIAHADPEQLAREGIHVQAWVGPVKQLFVGTTFAIFVWLMATFSSSGRQKYLLLRIVMLAALVLLLSVNGRRVVLSMLVVGSMIWSVARGQIGSRFTFRTTVRVGAAFAVFVMFSNLFQNVRSIIYEHTAIGATALPADFDLFDAMIRFQSTYENLQVRDALWRFHYAIMDVQLNDLTNVMGGELTWAGLLGIIPRLFDPEKGIVYGDDILVCNFYVVVCPHYERIDIDYPKTLYSGLQADYGLLFIGLAPFFVFAVLLLVARYGRLSRRGAIGGELYILVFGLSAELLVNIQQTIGNYFIFARDIAIVTLSVGLLQLLGWLASGKQRASA